MKEGAVVLAAVHAVADADPIRLAAGFETHLAAEAAAGESIHVGVLQCLGVYRHHSKGALR